MALARFVLQNDVTVTAGSPTGGTFGSASTPGSAWSELWGVKFNKGQIILADSSVGTTPPQLLYAAIGAGNLRAFVDGQDSLGREGLAN